MEKALPCRPPRRKISKYHHRFQSVLNDAIWHLKIGKCAKSDGNSRFGKYIKILWFSRSPVLWTIVLSYIVLKYVVLRSSLDCLRIRCYNDRTIIERLSQRMFLNPTKISLIWRSFLNIVLRRCIIDRTQIMSYKNRTYMERLY